MTPEQNSAPVPSHNRPGVFSVHRLFFVWSPEHELGIPIIDEQHRGAVSLANSLYYHMANPTGKAILFPFMQKFNRYLVLHAVTEEELLADTGYPDLEAHKALHAELQFDLKGAMRRAELSGNYGSVPEEFLANLKKWWMEHLNGADRDFVPYVRHILAQHTKNA